MKGNYCAFYVKEPFSESGLGAHAAKDFCYYNMLKMWKAKDPEFKFIDSHDKTYNVRDSSSWETLKNRLRQRLNQSKNIIFFLSSTTENSQALREEIDYGINILRLPVIIIYPEYKDKNSLLINGSLKYEVKNLWNSVPIFKKNMNLIPTLHVPLDKNLISNSLNNKDFMCGSKKDSSIYVYK